MIGIYKITNNLNNKKYIGQSRNIEKRFNKHRSESFNKNSSHYEYPLYRAIRKYGIENFSFEIIEECKIEELNEKEEFWIKYYDSFFNGYNQTLGGDGSGLCFNKDNVLKAFSLLETTDLIHKDIAEQCNMSVEMVQGINTGRYWRQEREYPIQKRTKERLEKIKENKNNCCIDCGKIIYKTSTRCVDCENKHRVQKLPITREELKKLIRAKSFVKIGEQFGVSDNAIRKWCDKYNLPRKKSEIKSYSDNEWEKI